MLIVGIPKEIKIGERRVGLTPQGVRVLTAHQVNVFVEKGAGLLSGFSDHEYEKAGARLALNGEEVWQKATLIKKVKEPIQQEFRFFKPHHIIFTYLHLASPSERPLVEALVKSKSTAIAYETIEKDGETPLLKPMSQVAGVLAAYFGAVFKKYIKVIGNKIEGVEKSKVLMNEFAAAAPAEKRGGLAMTGVQFLILGGGYVGEEAAKMAARMDGSVSLTEISEFRRKRLEETFSASGLNVQIIDPSQQDLYEEKLISSDILIACVHAPGKRAPLIINRETLKKISSQKRKIILDIAIDQGGNVAESQPSDYVHPLCLDSFGNVRFSVTNVPALCGRGASEAIEKASLDYTLALAGGLELAVKRYPELKSGLNVMNGSVLISN
ncbi:MAG: alanine dehydrogenase [Candidatus Omnitrophica bacterium]|nr:alanine dehydrogenase [Candidatus Omnitrophota bacterium]